MSKTRYWDPKAEAKHAEEFKRQLNGLNPGEFLLSEFIFRKRKNISRGQKIFVVFYPETSWPQHNIYAPYYDRFFDRKRKISPEHMTFIELNQNKKRVQSLLKE